MIASKDNVSEKWRAAGKKKLKKKTPTPPMPKRLFAQTEESLIKTLFILNFFIFFSWNVHGVRLASFRDRQSHVKLPIQKFFWRAFSRKIYVFTVIECLTRKFNTDTRDVLISAKIKPKLIRVYLQYTSIHFSLIKSIWLYKKLFYKTNYTQRNLISIIRTIDLYNKM